ncbi:glycosyltransferase family 2 protein [Cohnella lubricantis]|uniref:Glycosyltransferase family 2 protein n=1 Tax=Cohnella lubricantis TaxID=2163172 RepID=A0A841T7Q8_9BACL|nr:glycosyltransferase family 2 protein [Cohnella lubricantis]MBB6676129.1 glycosyltransferase family 2 protein [Cohnella lubricantis]MBP2118679.1 hypothetical protein [Cohnella lubricantis]
MLVFIWNAFGDQAVRRAEACVTAAWPRSRIVRLGAHPAKELRRELAGCSDPFFAVLAAGDAAEPEWFANVPAWLASLDDQEAGIIFQPEEQIDAPAAVFAAPRVRLPEIPQLWRTAAVRDGTPPAFVEQELGPFAGYGLIEMKSRLARGWSWKTVRSAAYHPASVHQRFPSWRRYAREWELLSPLLGAQPSDPPPSGNPLFTVVICSYNDADYLLWAVRSVMVQTRSDWELLIVDDGSTDNTEQVLRQSPLLRDARIRLLRHETNRGKSVCLNHALALAKGRWLLELDADDWLSLDCLAKLADSASAAEVEAESAVSGQDTGVLVADHVEWQERADRSLIPARLQRAPDSIDVYRLLDHPVAIAPRAYHVPLLKRLQGWRTTDPYGGRLYEDVQMLIRIGRIQTIRRIPAPLYHRRVRRTSVTQRNKALYPVWHDWMAASLASDS